MTPRPAGGVAVDNGWIAIEHRSESLGFYLPIHASNVLLKFGFDIQSQTEDRVWKLRNPIWPPDGLFLKWHFCKSIGLFPYTQEICYTSLDLISNPNFESDISENQWLFHIHK